jgi:hypothetical protein
MFDRSLPMVSFSPPHHLEDGTRRRDYVTSISSRHISFTSVVILMITAPSLTSQSFSLYLYLSLASTLHRRIFAWFVRRSSTTQFFFLLMKWWW